MTVVPPNPAPSRQLAWIWISVILTGISIWLDRKWPESTAYHVAIAVQGAFVTVWLGTVVVAGYRRRRPYWTSESWSRYLRLTAMPIAALVLLFTEMYFFDTFRSPAVFGASGSTLRVMWILIDLSLMGFGTIGLMLALGWLSFGEPSQPFTRTRWFRRPGKSAISD